VLLHVLHFARAGFEAFQGGASGLDGALITSQLLVGGIRLTLNGADAIFQLAFGGKERIQLLAQLSQLSGNVEDLEVDLLEG
jgi:hypothetical protein